MRGSAAVAGTVRSALAAIPSSALRAPSPKGRRKANGWRWSCGWV